MSSFCGICKQVIHDEKSDSCVKCIGGCEKLFHALCVKDDLEGKKTRSKRDWKCKECRNISSGTNCDSQTRDFLVKLMNDFKTEFFEKLKTFEGEMSELTTSVKFSSDKLDESLRVMKEVKVELAVLKKENEELRSRNLSLSSEVVKLNDKVRALEQYSRKNNIEISGLPVTPQENVVDLVKDVGTALGIEIDKKDISAIHRVPSFRKDRHSPLIVQFVSRSTRDNMITKFREKKKMTALEVNPSFPKESMYINEHLSPDNKVFISKLKVKCREIGYAYAWHRDGKFFVRKCQGEKYKKVDTYDELNKLN